MSGPGKKVVDVTFKASKNIDWEGMAKLLVSDEARKEFATLRRTFDEFTIQAFACPIWSQRRLFWLFSFCRFIVERGCDYTPVYEKSAISTHAHLETNMTPKLVH
ncbi:hypothetical protein Gotur_023295 [Gossypium turneri]